jgi:hypothetical protein
MSDTPGPLLEKNLFEAIGAARFGALIGEWPLLGAKRPLAKAARSALLRKSTLGRVNVGDESHDLLCLQMTTALGGGR